LLVEKAGLSIKGTAIATVITHTINLIAISIYMSHSNDLKEAWFFPNKHCFHGLYDYLKLGIASTLMLCLEWWCFEALALLSGYISVDATGAMVIVLNANYILFMFPVGLQVATSAHVGRAIG
jgi:MATE family multidrug resistance protein